MDKRMRGTGAAIMAAALLVSACAAPRTGGTAVEIPSRHPRFDVHAVEYGGVRSGLVRGIVGAPEEMLDTAVRNAGSFGPAEARGLRNALQAEAQRSGFTAGDTAKAMALRVRVTTHLARVGEIWPEAEFLVEAEYVINGRPPRGVYMYYGAWFYWSMQSLRRDVLADLARKIVNDIESVLERGTGESHYKGGHAKFFNTANEAREEFFE